MKELNNLVVYNKAYEAAMEIFEVTKSFPKEEQYGLTDQVRRSSRALCAMMSEAYRRRKYPDYFMYKMMEADSECSETITWLAFARSCNYLPEDSFKLLDASYREIGRLLGGILRHAEKFSLPGTSEN